MRRGELWVVCGWLDSPLRALMFQQTGGRRNERTTEIEDEGERGRKRMTKRGEDCCRGIGGHLRKETKRDKAGWLRERELKD